MSEDRLPAVSHDLIRALEPDSLLLVGGGNMGAALLRGLIAAGMKASAVRVIEPNDPARCLAAGVPADRISASADPAWRPRVILLAVKPQIVAEATAGLAALAGPGTLLLSILAGTTRARLADLFGGHERIIRAMPNTPAAIGAGATVLVGGDSASADDRALAEALMAAAGSVHWVESEAQMDAVTALSGSGPAYVFHLIECLAAAGEHVGLPRSLAQDLARETVIGAGMLAQVSPEAAATLRQQVTSPGGTTEAGLDVLMGPDGLAPLIRHTVEAATRRSKELGK